MHRATARNGKHINVPAHVADDQHYITFTICPALPVLRAVLPCQGLTLQPPYGSYRSLVA